MSEQAAVRFEDDAPAGTSISDIGGEQELVAALGAAMLAKLAKNRGKRHWDQAQPGYLLDRLAEEVDELNEAVGSFLELNDATAEDVWAEAADVSNFAAMVAANVAGIPATDRSEAHSALREVVNEVLDKDYNLVISVILDRLADRGYRLVPVSEKAVR